VKYIGLQKDGVTRHCQCYCQYGGLYPSVTHHFYDSP